MATKQKIHNHGSAVAQAKNVTSNPIRTKFNTVKPGDVVAKASTRMPGRPARKN